jgi:hypothetical protein
MRKKRNMYRLLVRKPEGRRPLGRQIQRWMDNISWILERQDGVVWTGLLWLRNSVMSLWVP